MKKQQSLFMFALAVQAMTSTRRDVTNADFGTGSPDDNLYTGDPNEVSYGSPEISYGGPADGMIPVGAGDIDDLMSGAVSLPTIAKPVVGDKLAARFGSGGLKNFKIPSVIAENARVVQYNTNQPLSGALIEWNLKRHRADSPFVSVIKTAVPIAGTATVTIASADLAALADIQVMAYTVPVIFVTIAASQLAARAGNQYQIRLSGLTEGLSLSDATPFTIERSKLNDAIRLTIFPFKRVRDDVKPVTDLVTQIGPVTWNEPISGAPFTVNSPYLIEDAVPVPVGATLRLEVQGCAADETVTVKIPGLDSAEIKSFMRVWKVKA